MKRKRILHVEGNEDGTVGGSHKIMADLVTRMPRSFEPVILFYQTNLWVDRLRDAGLEVHTWDRERSRELDLLRTGGALATLDGLMSSIRRRAEFLREHRIDLVLLNNSHRHHLDEWIPATELAGVPCAAYAMGAPAREPSPVRRFLMRRLRQVFPLSQLMKDGVLSSDYPESRITLAYPGLDLATIRGRTYRPADEVRREFSVGPDQLLAVMTGNLRPWKGQHTVVEGVGHLPASLRDRLRLVFAGDTRGYEEYAEQVKSRMRELDVEESIVFGGWRNDVPDLLEAADIAVHSSVVPEPFGLVVLEAMAHGCATIAADRGGPVEMIDPGVSGLTFDTEAPRTLADGLARLIEDEALRTRMAEAARDRAREFDQSRHVQLMTDAFDRLIAS